MSLVGFSARNHPQQKAQPSVDDRGTPPDLFAAWHERYRFTVDAAAAPHNAKLPRFWTEADNGLLQPWDGERVWCNPPYSAIWPWVRKAWGEPKALVVMLLPANRTEQRWWQEEIEPRRDQRGSRLSVHFLPGRIRFLAPGQEVAGPNERPPFGCALLVWQVAP